jgi:catechol 2,3-dioxygenase-like lactoylglutathione lyase family enzyme
VDWTLELVVVPVSDVDRAKAFYIEKTGFVPDVDHRASETFRVVQLTPPGSACSISIGTGLTSMAPGSLQGLQLVVADIEAAHATLCERGAEPSDIFHFASGSQVPGPDPEHKKYESFFSFSDPDGNGWMVQEVRRTETNA